MTFLFITVALIIAVMATNDYEKVSDLHNNIISKI